MVAAAQYAGNEQRLCTRLLQRKPQLRGAEDRQQRIDRGPEPGGSEEGDRRLPPVGQLVGDDVTRAEAQGTQPAGNPVDLAAQISERQTVRAVNDRLAIRQPLRGALEQRPKRLLRPIAGAAVLRREGIGMGSFNGHGDAIAAYRSGPPTPFSPARRFPPAWRAR